MVDPGAKCLERADTKKLTGQMRENFIKECTWRITETNKKILSVRECKIKVLTWNKEDHAAYAACLEPHQKAGKTGKALEEMQSACETQINRNRLTQIDYKLVACDELRDPDAPRPDPAAVSGSAPAPPEPALKPAEAPKVNPPAKPKPKSGGN